MVNIRKRLNYFLFLILGLTIILLNIFIGYKIFRKSQFQVKGTNIITMSKNDLIFDSTRLKYFYEPKPDITIIDKPEWLDHEVKYTINRDSLNERFDYQIPKPVSTYRILTLGDSYTFGSLVNTSENYSEYLEDKLNNNLECTHINHFDVINLGVGGYDLAYIVERYFKRGLKYKPDLIVWLLNPTNMLNINEITYPLRESYQAEKMTGSNTLRGVMTPPPGLRDLNKIMDAKSILNYQNEKLTEMNNYLNQEPSNMLIISFPEMTGEQLDLIKNFINFNKSKYTYYGSLFPVYNHDQYHLANYHPNPEGHKKIAGDIFEYLTSNYIKECKDKRINI